MRPLLAICLLAALGMQYATRLTGYVQCVVTTYMVQHTGLAVDCECIRHLAATFGEDQPGDRQMQAKPVVLKVQDYVPVASETVVLPRLLPSRPETGMLPSLYRYTGASAIFHPPCEASSSFFI
ncbi:hypothetical protein ACFOTA_01390 [Chitinophaga sp. GCM10012297]|uniref:Uncharacterized protein n=1 Tax=Chitinophaga chungangae TaxID=2821488 RepID=A0ABS3Y846_9BACT|nr:hypothetical protein [Chitinophaga chungangae]MBO9150846.1 hypothetical protein [Chitinophaga chungangae]